MGRRPLVRTLIALGGAAAVAAMWPRGAEHLPTTPRPLPASVPRAERPTARRAQSNPVPRFIAGPPPASLHGVPDELEGDQAQQLVLFDLLARRQAAAVASLTDAESVKVDEINDRFDRARGALEGRVDPSRGTLASDAMALLAVNQADALDELGRVLGRQRARRLLEAEREAGTELWKRMFAQESSAARAIALRRLLVRQSLDPSADENVIVRAN